MIDRSIGRVLGQGSSSSSLLILLPELPLQMLILLFADAISIIVECIRGWRLGRLIPFFGVEVGLAGIGHGPPLLLLLSRRGTRFHDFEEEIDLILACHGLRKILHTRERLIMKRRAGVVDWCLIMSVVVGE